MATRQTFSQTLSDKYERERWFLLVLGLIPLLFFFLFVWGLPIAYALWMSLLADPLGEGVFVGFQNYTEVLAGGEFWNSLRNSVVYAVSTTGLSLLLGLVSALAINNLSRGSNFLRTFLILPYLIPVLVVVFMWEFLLSQTLGVVNQFLVALGIVQSPIAFFGSMTWAMPSVVMTSVWKWTPFAFFIILAQVQTIDTDLYERARIQGATTWQAFRDITLPNLKSAILIIILVRGIWMFNKFDVIWLTTKGGPIETTNTLPIQVYKLAFTSLEFGQATALAGIMFTLLVAAGLLYFYLFSPSEEVAN